MQADIGVIGLGVMGRNLALNFADNGFEVAVYNRTTSRVDEFIREEGAAAGIIGVHNVAELAAGLRPPRRVLLMVKAGEAVDATIAALLPHLEAGDIVIDGGNSEFTDTIRRTAELEAQGFRFVGMGVSGGEEGARHGPSLMPGGSPPAWPSLRDMLQAVAAKVADGTPCCDWVGPDGAGHYVKMVHNGIEYGDMQVIAEAYQLLHDGLGLDHDRMAEIFAAWSSGPLDSYLIDITADIMRKRDEDGRPLLEVVLDAAGQKGTGKWTAMSSLDLGQPVTLVTEAVYARILSALKEERIRAEELLGRRSSTIPGDPDEVVEDIRRSLLASKIVSYAQGFMLLRAAAAEHGWDLDYGGIAYLWREGCIIRSVLLEHIKGAYEADPELSNLLLSPFFRNEIGAVEESWRRTITRAIAAGIPVPAYSSALAFYDGYRSARLPANLIQAQRDYFGAHTYERVDRPRGESFHSDWGS